MAAFAAESENQAELFALRGKLNSHNPDERKTAARQVVSMMRAGERVGQLFTDMLKCVTTDDLELKKLVYLFTDYVRQSFPQGLFRCKSPC
jgi:vesicle coat complex subunit